jgi:hypothetical protein
LLSGFKDLPTSPDDPRLVEITVSLCQQLEISDLAIRQVRWWGLVPTSRDPSTVPSDWCTFTRHSVVLPVHMMGRLSVEEWQPLIASSLIYEKKVTRTLRRRLVYAIGLVFLLLGGPLIASALLRMVWIAVFYVVFVVPAFFLAPRLYYPYVKKARLLADTEASEVVGRDSILDVFKKIDMMGLWDIENRKTRRGGRRGLPSITERIDNLQRYSPN